MAMHDPQERGLIAEPAEEVIELTKEAVRAMTATRQRRKPQAALDVITQTVRELVKVA